MAHTPGPWEVTKQDRRTKNWYIGKPDSNALPRFQYAIAVFGAGAGLDESEANARLIAAAPEMEANLILSTRFLELEAEGHRAKGEIEKAQACEGQVKQNRAVLAKAEGK